MKADQMSSPIWRRGDSYPADWPEWLRKADIEWCRVDIDGDGPVIWHDGIWHGGIWRNGVWRNGVWRDGVWYRGEWRYDGPPRLGGAK